LRGTALFEHCVNDVTNANQFQTTGHCFFND